MANHCSVFKCSNSYEKIRNWKKEECNIHGHILHKDCPCLIPYKLHTFPSDPENCRQWVAAIKRKNFVPTRTSAVCSVHFIDGRPTKVNPIPQINLGYVKQVKRGRREIIKHQPVCKYKKIENAMSSCETQQLLEDPHEDFMQPETISSLFETGSGPPTADDSERNTKSTGTEDLLEHANLQCSCTKVQTKEVATQWEDLFLIDHNYIKASTLSETKDKQCQIEMPVFTQINNDNTCKFYSGLSLAMFLHVVNALKPFGEFSRKMCLEDQILLVLMRLRLGLLYGDLARRFNISIGFASDLFSNWIKIMSLNLGKIVCWLPREVIQATMPAAFKLNYCKTTCVIDCSEIFIQKASLLRSRNKTFSHYKKHNTGKFLIAVAPNGFIMFISRMYGGKASDKFIVNDSGFLRYIQPGDEIMADRGFTIEEEIFPLQVSLNIPAFLRGKKQLTEQEVVKTRRIASVRIHVERVINRMKVFRLLKYVFPLSQKRLMDDVVLTIAALCNLQDEIIKDV